MWVPSGVECVGRFQPQFGFETRPSHYILAFWSGNIFITWLCAAEETRVSQAGWFVRRKSNCVPSLLLALDNSDKQTDQSTDRTVLYSSFFDVGGHPLPLSAALHMQALSTFLWTSSCWTCHKRWSIKHWTAGRLWRSCDLHTSFLMFFDYSQLSRSTSRPLRLQDQRPLEPIGVSHWLQRPLAHTYKVHSEWCRYKGQTQLRPC